MDIFEASESGDVGRIEELVKSGISVNSRRADWTPLIIATIYNKVEAAQFLYDIYQDDGGYTALHLAGDNVEIVQMLADWGAELEIRNNVGMTPVNYAALWGNLRVVRLMANMGVNLITVDVWGNSPAKMPPLMEKL